MQEKNEIQQITQKDGREMGGNHQGGLGGRADRVVRPYNIYRERVL